ncbi:Transmembrane BAX inhibitor motif-containing protein 4 [Irineochytrium annulatum]|nr:Transmembrane BAX inhibitor motif-containing protein 4 [Irineochytrium annulatum]
MSGHGYGAVPTYSEAQPPHYDEEGLFEKKLLVDESPLIRMNFIRKVYSILSAQLGLTTIVSAIFMYSAPVKEFVQGNAGLTFFSWIVSLGVLIALMVYRRSSPTNMYLLFTFTALEAYSIGTVCTFYDSMIVLQATILTFMLFIGLTLFTAQSKIDFSGMGPFLFGALWIVIIGSFLQMFLPFSKITDLIFAIVVAVLFCGYIVYDTYMLFERFSPEDYIIASVELYLDVLNLFLAILRILNNAQDS